MVLPVNEQMSDFTVIQRVVVLFVIEQVLDLTEIKQSFGLDHYCAGVGLD